MRTPKAISSTRQRTEEQVSQKVKILLHEHTSIRAEVLAFVGYYMNHVRNFQLVLVGLFGAIAFITANWEKLKPSSLPIWYLWLAGTTLVPIVSGYLAFDIIYAAYVMALLGARNGCIEKQIALLVGPNLMIWETQIVNILYKERRVANVMNPAFMQGIFFAFLGLFVMVLAPMGSYYVLWSQAIDVPGKRELLMANGAVSILVFATCILYAKRSILDTRKTANRYVDALVFQDENPSASRLI